MRKVVIVRAVHERNGNARKLLAHVLQNGSQAIAHCIKKYFC